MHKNKREKEGLHKQNGKLDKWIRSKDATIKPRERGAASELQDMKWHGCIHIIKIRTQILYVNFLKQSNVVVGMCSTDNFEVIY